MGVWVRGVVPVGQVLVGSHRWCELGAAEVPGTDAKIGLGGWTGPVWIVGAFGRAVGDVLGGQLGCGQASSIIVRCVGRPLG